MAHSRQHSHGRNAPGDQGSSNVEFEGIMAQWLRCSQGSFSSTCRQLWGGRLSCQDSFSLWAAPGNGRYAAEDNTGMLDDSSSVVIANCHAHQWKIAGGAFPGFEIRAFPGWLRRWNGHSHQDFIVSQDILALYISLWAGKKLFERQRTLSGGAGQ